MQKATLAIVLLLVAVIPCLAQGFGNECTPAGTWYGGAPDPNPPTLHSPKYLLTIVPTRAGHYSIRADEGFSTNPAVVAKLSEFSGELIKLQDGTYKAYVLGLANPSSVPPPMGGLDPQIWAIHEHASLTDCNTLVFEVTFNAVYSWGLRPFLDTPNLLKPVASETYHRMATWCELCGDVEE